MKPVFLIGAALLAHAFYAALSMQEALQAHHHGASSTLKPLDLTSSTLAESLPLWIIVEVIIGMVLAMLGYIAQAQLQKIRMQDHQVDMRYEQCTYTGTDFVHFNHRGAVVSSKQ